MTGQIAMSERLARMVDERPGARYAYLTIPYAKLLIDGLDVQWQAVVDAVSEIADPDVGVAEAVADRFVQIMLDRYDVAKRVT